MRNKVVKQMLMFGMASMLAVSSPVVGWASENETETEAETQDEKDNGDILKITENNVGLMIYQDEKLSLSFSECSYTENASDIQFSMDLQNNYSNIFKIDITDVKVDGSPMKLFRNSGEYKAGDSVFAFWSIDLEQLQAAGLTDFQEVSYTITGTLNDGTEVFKKDIVMERKAFASLSDSEDSSNEEKEDTSDKDKQGSLEESVNKDEDVIKITTDNMTPVIYDDNDIKVSVQKMAYDENWGNPFYNLIFSVENNSDKDVQITMNDAFVDDFQTATYSGNYTVASGKKGVTDFSIWEKDFVPYGIEDFKTWESTLQIFTSDEVMFEKTIKIDSSVFGLDSSSDMSSVDEDGNNNDSSIDASGVNVGTDAEVQEPIEVYNDDGVKITITQYEKTEYGSAKLTMNVVNLNHHDLRISSSNNVVVNGTTSNCTPFGEIQSGKTGDVVLELYPEQMGGLAVKDIQTIEFRLSIWVSENNRQSFKAESNDIYLSVDGDTVAQRVVYTDKENIQKVQQLLNSLGYNSGSTDGVPGKLTNSAILQFQKDHGLPESTDITPELIAELEKATQQ